MDRVRRNLWVIPSIIAFALCTGVGFILVQIGQPSRLFIWIPIALLVILFSFYGPYNGQSEET